MTENVILAGATSVPGHNQILEAFSSIGMRATFIEAPFVKKYTSLAAGTPVAYTATAPADCLVIPLSEYWISQCMKERRKNISDRALKASRSKKLLYECTFFDSFNNS